MPERFVVKIRDIAHKKYFGILFTVFNKLLFVGYSPVKKYPCNIRHSGRTANYIPREIQANLIQSGVFTKQPVLLSISLRLLMLLVIIFCSGFLNNGLSIYEASLSFYSNPDSVK